MLIPKYVLEDLSVGSGSIIRKSNIEEFFNHTRWPVAPLAQPAESKPFADHYYKFWFFHVPHRENSYDL
jgi:hypothetical protein